MSLQKINNYWSYLEKKTPPPKYVGKVSNLDFMTLKRRSIVVMKSF